MTCDPISVPVTGDQATDILGTWDGWGIDSHVVAEFSVGGAGRFVEAPNRYAPSGNASAFSYSFDAQARLVGVGGQPLVVRISETALEEIDPSTSTVARTHPRVRCEGFGF